MCVFLVGCSFWTTLLCVVTRDLIVLSYKATIFKTDLQGGKWRAWRFVGEVLCVRTDHSHIAPIELQGARALCILGAYMRRTWTWDSSCLWCTILKFLKGPRRGITKCLETGRLQFLCLFTPGWIWPGVYFHCSVQPCLKSRCLLFKAMCCYYIRVNEEKSSQGWVLAKKRVAEDGYLWRKE